MQENNLERIVQLFHKNGCKQIIFWDFNSDWTQTSRYNYDATIRHQFFVPNPQLQKGLYDIIAYEGGVHNPFS